MREAQKAETRDRLTSAARGLFEERGYVDVSVDDIARAAGFTRATFYLHFASKAALLSEVLQRSGRQEELGALLQDFASIPQPTVEALERYVDAYVDFYLRHQGLHRALHQAQVVEPEFMQRRLEDVSACVALWQSLGLVPDASPEELRMQAIMMFALMDTTMHLWFDSRTGIDRRSAVHALTGVFQHFSWFHRA